MQIFKRKAYDKLLEWKDTRNGRSAVLLEGARRVGKSTLAETFAKEQYRSYILVDFIDEDYGMTEMLESGLKNLDTIFLRLQLNSDVRLYERESVIIFDEVQRCPKAREMIKNLVKDRRYDYIETGSLISLKSNTRGIRIPSEEHSLR
ncbi:MAG: AAA family ATPase [Candidatus Methanomethylophilaceae archaeon]|nr:AAA family ATPase [Candidatus Methanomethylophilaceae archaeon]